MIASVLPLSGTQRHSETKLNHNGCMLRRRPWIVAILCLSTIPAVSPARGYSTRGDSPAGCARCNIMYPDCATEYLDTLCPTGPVVACFNIGYLAPDCGKYLSLSAERESHVRRIYPHIGPPLKPGASTLCIGCPDSHMAVYRPIQSRLR